MTNPPPGATASLATPVSARPTAAPLNSIADRWRTFPANQTLQFAILAVVVLVGTITRSIAALRLSPHVDEASSILAAHATATHGWPILPSGTVYFQGATLSWLLAPLVWLGYGDLDHLGIMRIVPVIAGVATVYLCYRFGTAVAGDARVGIVMAGLVAIDPISVQWSGHVRMYGLLQAFTVALVWAFVRLLDAPSWRRVVPVVVLSWLVVFTHVGASLVLAAIGLALILVHGRLLWRRIDLMAGVVLCGLAPVTLLILNRMLGTASVGAGTSSSGPFTFVGDNLLQPLTRFRASIGPGVLDALIRQSTLIWLVPGLVVALATVIGGRFLLRHQLPIGPGRDATVALLVIYWLPVVAVGAFVASPKERYLLHVHVTGYLFVACLLVAGIGIGIGRWPVAVVGDRARLLVNGLMVVVGLAVVSTLFLRLEDRVVHPDYHSAMAYVADHHQPGEPIIVALPAISYLALEGSARDDVVYLAGSEGQPRAQRYTRITPEGDQIDYWVGVEAITTIDDLRHVLETNPDAWIVVDEERLNADWAYRGAVEETIGEMALPVHETSGGGLILRPR